MGLSKNFAYRLRTLREAAGLSQQEVAERADLSFSLITKMEQGRKADPRASTLLALAGVLGVRPGQLIEDLTPPPEGFFPPKKKGKKGKKKKKKRLAALMAAAVNSEGTDTTLGGMLVTPETLPVANGHGDEKQRKKKKKK